MTGAPETWQGGKSLPLWRLWRCWLCAHPHLRILHSEMLQDNASDVRGHPLLPKRHPHCHHMNPTNPGRTQVLQIPTCILEGLGCHCWIRLASTTPECLCSILIMGKGCDWLRVETGTSASFHTGVQWESRGLHNI